MAMRMIETVIVTVLMIMAMGMSVIMTVGVPAEALKVSAVFRHEHGFGMYDSQFQQLQHLFQHMIRRNTQPAIPHLQLHMPVAQVITGTGKGVPVIATGFGYRLYCTFYFHNLSAVGSQIFTYLKGGAALQKYAHLFAIGTGQAQPAAIPLLMIQGHCSVNRACFFGAQAFVNFKHLGFPIHCPS